MLAPMPTDSDSARPSPSDAESLLLMLSPGLIDNPKPADKAASRPRPRLADNESVGGGIQAYTLK
jgi:hypothetical protein